MDTEPIKQPLELGPMAAVDTQDWLVTGLVGQGKSSAWRKAVNELLAKLASGDWEIVAVGDAKEPAASPTRSALP